MDSSFDSNYFIKKFNMIPHPEGGYYVETNRSDLNVFVENEENQLIKRPAYTSIYFLLTKTQFSRFHKIKSDESFHFYFGSFTIVELIDNNKDCQYKLTVIGNDIEKGELLQYVVKRNQWFGFFPNDNSSFCFFSCNVAPGFVFEDFEISKRSELLRLYPNARDLIIKLTNND